MKIMPIREFLRGGYHALSAPTIVMKHGRPIFTAIPATTKPEPDTSQVKKEESVHDSPESR